MFANETIGNVRLEKHDAFLPLLQAKTMGEEADNPVFPLELVLVDTCSQWHPKPEG